MFQNVRGERDMKTNTVSDPKLDPILEREICYKGHDWINHQNWNVYIRCFNIVSVKFVDPSNCIMVMDGSVPTER